MTLTNPAARALVRFYVYVAVIAASCALIAVSVMGVVEMIASATS